MEKITAREFDKIEGVKGHGRKPSKEVVMLLALKAGEGLTVKRSEWTLKTPPMDTVHRFADRKFKTRKTVDGWAILRVK